MRLTFILGLLIVKVSGDDACGELCRTHSDCSHGSYNKKGFCHGMFRTGESTFCIHTALTRASCPKTLERLTLVLAETLLSRHRTASTIPAHSTATSAPRATTVSPVTTPAPPTFDSGVLYLLNIHAARKQTWQQCGHYALIQAAVNDVYSYDTEGSSRLHRWETLGGPDLLRIAQTIPPNSAFSNADREAVYELIPALFTIAHDDPTSESSMKEFTHTHASVIGIVLLAHKHLQQYVEYIYKLNPDLFKTVELRAVRLEAATKEIHTTYVNLAVSRHKCFKDSARVLTELGIDFSSVHVQLVNEIASGEGVLRDWFSEVTKQLGALSIMTPQTHAPFLSMFSSDAINKVHLKFVGMLLGLALTSRVSLGLNLPIYYVSYLLDRPLTNVEEIRQDEPDLYRSLTAIMNMSKAELEASQLEMELVGSPTQLITKKNRQQLVSLKLNSLIPKAIKKHLDFVKAGLFKVIPKTIVQEYLTNKDMKNMIYGSPRISIAELKRHVVFSEPMFYGESKYTMESQEIKWLFALLDSFDQKDRNRFVRFVTGSSQLPPAGFGALTQPIKIVKKVESADESLPTSQTCFNTFVLPTYSSEKILRQKVTLAIRSDPAMGLS